MRALNWIFDAIIDWIVGKVVRVALDWITAMGLTVFGLDFTIFNSYYPYIGNTTILIRSIAMALLFAIVTWQIFRAFLGPLTDAESPIALIGRTGIAVFFIIFAYDLVDVIRRFAVSPLNTILDRRLLDSSVDHAKDSFSFENIFDWVVDGIKQQSGEQLKKLVENNLIMELIVAILILVIAWNYFKLLLEIIERYVVFAILSYLSPLAFALSASKSTVNIFKAYLRMLMSEIFLIVMNGWFLYGFNSSVDAFISDKGVVTTDGIISETFLVSGRITWCLMAIAYLKICQRFDMYLAQMGLNTAQTGGFLAAEIAMAAKTVSNTAGKAFRTAKGIGDKISNARTGGHGGMLGNYLAMKNGQFESRPNTKTINDTAKGMDKAGMFNAFSGGNAAKMSSTEKDYLAGMAAKASDVAKAVNPGLVLGSTNADEAMRALHGGLLSKDNIVPGSSKFSTDTNIGNAAGKIGSTQTTLDYGKFGKVNFSSRTADGNMQSGEFMFKGADGQARYGKLEPADPSNPNSAIAMGAAKAQMMNQSKMAAMSGLSDEDRKAVLDDKKDVSGIGGGALISDGGNVFTSANANDTTGQKILDTLNGVRGSMDKMSGPGVDASAGFAIPAFQGKSVVGEFTQNGFKGVGINPDGSITPLELTKGMPKDGKQGSAVLDRNGNPYTAKVGGDSRFASAAEQKAANQFKSSLNEGKNSVANDLRNNINSAIAGTPPTGFNANTAAGSLAAIAGLNPSGAVGAFNANGGTIKAKDANGNAVTTTLSKGKNGEWNAKSTTTDPAGNTLSKSAASGTNAASVMQAAMNPAGFELGASQKDGGIPNGVDRVSSTNALDQKMSKLAENTYNGGISNLDNLSDIKTTQTSASAEGISSNLVLTDSNGNSFSTPMSMKPSFDNDGNLTGYTATVGEGKDAMNISGSSESEVMGKAMQVANAEGIAAGVLSNEGTDAYGNAVQAFGGDDVKSLLTNSSGINPDTISSAAMTDNGIQATAFDTQGNEIAISGNSIADVGEAIKNIENGNVEGAVASGAVISGEGLSDYIAEKSGVDAGSISSASISKDGVSATFTDSNGNNTVISADSIQQFADAANMTESGNIQGAIDSGAVLSGAAASSFIASAAGIESSNIANASVSGTEISASVTDNNGNVGNITAPNVDGFNAAVLAANNGKEESVNNAVALGASISGDSANSILSKQSGETVSNGSISSDGVSGTIVSHDGKSTEINAADTASFGYAASSAASGNIFAMSAAMNEGASYEGASAMSYLTQNGVNTSQMSDASISKGQMNAIIGDSTVSASTPHALNEAISAASNGDVSAMTTAIENGASYSGGAAGSYLAHSGVDLSNAVNATASSDGYSVEMKDGSTVYGGNVESVGSAISAMSSGSNNAIDEAINNGASISGNAAVSYLSHNGVDVSGANNASVSSDGYSVEMKDGSVISGGSVETVGSAVSAVSSGDTNAISNAINGGAVISGDTAASYVAGESGVDVSSISNASVSSDGYSVEMKDGSVVSGGSVETVGSAVSAISSGDTNAISDAVNGGAVISGDAAASYISNESGIDVSSISNASVSSDGYSATITTSEGVSSHISAEDTATMAQLSTAIEKGSAGDIQRAIDNGGSVSGEAADKFFNDNTSDASYTNSTMSKENYSADIQNSSGSYSVQSSNSEDMKNASSFNGDYDSVMKGNYGTAQISGSDAPAAFAEKFGGSASDYSHASFSHNSAYAERPDSHGNTERMTTVYDPSSGGYTTKIETVDKNGSVIFSKDLTTPTVGASKVVAEATASAYAPARVDSIGNPDAKYYGTANVTMTSKDTGVIKSANGNVENVSFDRSGKNIVAVNGQKLNASINYTGDKTPYRTKTNKPAFNGSSSKSSKSKKRRR